METVVWAHTHKTSRRPPNANLTPQRSPQPSHSPSFGPTPTTDPRQGSPPHLVLAGDSTGTHGASNMHMRYCGRRSRTRSSSSVFATPPPGSTCYMRWEITGRLRNLETIPLLPPLLRRPPRNRRGTASVVTAEAQLSLQPPPTLSTLVARHRRAALATDEPLSPPTSRSRHRRAARLLQLDSVACEIPLALIRPSRASS